MFIYTFFTVMLQLKKNNWGKQTCLFLLLFQQPIIIFFSFFLSLISSHSLFSSITPIKEFPFFQQKLNISLIKLSRLFFQLQRTIKFLSTHIHTHTHTQHTTAKYTDKNYYSATKSNIHKWVYVIPQKKTIKNIEKAMKLINSLKKTRVLGKKNVKFCC